MTINPKRFYGYLATGTMPEATALDESLLEHDKRYHGGNFDPKTMKCGKRDGMALGDNSDFVITEGLAETKYREVLAKGSAFANARTDELAPNGKRSNLSNALYYLVRTKQFKDWFGDWEKYTLGEATESECKNMVKKWHNTHKAFKNNDSGRIAELKADWPKLFSAEAKGLFNNYEAHYAAVMSLDRLFEKSVRMWGERPRNGSQDISEYAKYGQPFIFKGDVYLAKMTVKEYAKHVGIRDGFYSIEAVSVEKVNVVGNNGDISIKGRILDHNVGRIIANRILECNGVSKMVDENGEPLVCWHGGRENNSFTEFSRKKAKDGFFFAPPNRRDSVAGYYGHGEERPFFLNIRNPKKFWAGKKDFVKLGNDNDGMISYVDEDWESSYYNYRTDKVCKEKLKKGDICEVIAFKPNQIKLANNNSGRFSNSADTTDEAISPIDRYLDYVNIILSEN